jgi:hypothetical protein
MILGIPLQAQEVRHSSSDPLVTRAIKESASTESCATPAMLAEVVKILSDQGVLADDRAEREPSPV